MKHTLQLRLSQHLTLTPQLQQSIRLLQLSTLELNQELERFLQENPLLEREDDAEAEAPSPEEGSFAPPEFTSPERSPREESEAPAAQETPEYDAEARADRDWLEDDGGSYGPRDDSDEPEYPQVPASSASLRDHLLWQLNVTNLPDRDKRIVAMLIDMLDDEGYLGGDLQELVEMLPAELEIDLEELQIALRHLQNMEPAGIGARTLSESLVLQLEAMPADTPLRKEAIHTAKNYLDILAAKDYGKLKKLLHCDDNILRGIQSLIVSLNPRPGSSYGNAETRYVIPDVVVKKLKGTWLASLNPDAMPKLRINRMYADILSRNRDASFQQLAGQLQEAKWLIKNVQQRFDTILRVSQAIVDRQRHFFEHGEVAMRPLVLREIAETLGLHESTVSRVTTQKFMFTPRGIFELKYFFGSHVATETGGACSATAIRALIKQLVSAEDSKKPLSDSQISEILGQQGIVVARRTVAKYRESLQILPVNLRKSI